MSRSSPDARQIPSGQKISRESSERQHSTPAVQAGVSAEKPGIPMRLNLGKQELPYRDKALVANRSGDAVPINFASCATGR